MFQPTYREGLDESFIRCRKTARKVLDVWATPQQQMCPGGQGEYSDREFCFLQGGRKELETYAGLHWANLEGV